MRRLELDRAVVRFGREDTWSLVEVGSTFVLVDGVEARSCRLVVVRRLPEPGHELLELALALVPELGRGLVLELGAAVAAEQVVPVPVPGRSCGGHVLWRPHR